MSWIQSDFQKESTPYVPPSWSTGTDAEIVEALQKHYAGQIDLHDYWAIGDERIIHLSAMDAMSPLEETHAERDVPFVLSEIGGKYLSDGVTECAFQVDQKDLIEPGKINYYLGDYIGGWKQCLRRTWCNSTYKNAIPSTIRPIFKEFINQSCCCYDNNAYRVENTNDYFALRADVEVFGSSSNPDRSWGTSGEGTQVEWYKNTLNWHKLWLTYYTFSWWLRSQISYGYSSSVGGNFIRVMNSTSNPYDMDVGTGEVSQSYYLAPFGVI